MGEMSTWLHGLALLFLGYTSANKHVKVCYGDTFVIPKHLTAVFRQKIYYTPAGGVRRLVANNGQSLDPLFTFSPSSYSKSGWTHQDEGAIVVPSVAVVTSVSVIDCKNPKMKKYGESISWLLLSGTQYLEFVPLGLSPLVLWNDSDTDPRPRRGVMEDYRFTISFLTQKDSGYYNFRGAHNELLTWENLEVTYHDVTLSYYTGDALHYEYPFTFTEWKASHVPQHNTSEPDLEHRVKMSDKALDIESVEKRDEGSYEFVDYEDNMILHIYLKVTERRQNSVWIFGTIIVPIVAVLFCCCCFSRCRAKEKSPKHSQQAPEPYPELASHPVTPSPAGPTVYHHEMAIIQPSDSANSPFENGSTTKCSEPTVESSEPTSYNSVIPDMNPSAKFPVSGGFGFSTASSDPQFNIRGMTFLSASPLSSDTNTSENMNFL